MSAIHFAAVIYFFILGLCFGSFALATAWRIHKRKNFVRDRSKCENCKHVLAPLDLIPVVSWLMLKGKCRYCKKPLSGMMPLAELFAGAVFAATFAYWPDGFHGPLNLLRFTVWCTALVLLLVLFFYDLQWLLLPNKLMYPLWAVAAADFVLRFVQAPSWHTLTFGIMSVAVSAGVFYMFFVVSHEQWIGFGDVRLGLAIGLLLGHPLLAGLTLFFSSIVGVLAVIPSVIKHKTTLKSKIPYGPLLIFALIVVRLFGSRFIDWYTVHILLL